MSDARIDLMHHYTQLRGSLLGYLRRQVGDPDQAEDLLQDVLLKALAALPAAAPENHAAWLYRIARNAAVDHLRRQRISEPLDDVHAAPEDEHEEATVAALAQCLRPVAEQLPEIYRTTVIAAEFEGAPLAELAAREGVSLSAVKSRASRGRQLLQQALVDCCRLVLSARGGIADYDDRAVAACRPTAGGPPRCN